ncbi:sulfotransferase [Actinomadura craniellae]|uniref:Sulfotransferase n=1 Tax=Actinomadura craniellae TaxID=2231787 RepID=A0A365GX38_9ACTN|nr:sulfotransferase [Actinomadura craniellae]RAY11395.1 sulfotransferase [Actinomadura craniellae]
MTVVLHVTGAGRSGSTLLGGLLGQIDGFFNVGEAGYLWERGLAAGGDCGCGAPVRHCPVWRDVLARAYGGPDAPETEALRRLHARTSRGRAVQALSITGRLPGERAAVAAAAPLGRLYPAVAEVTGARVIIDTTKPATYGRLLSRLPGLDLRYVHLVRDPRAVAWSWLRVKESRETMVTRPPVTSALLWRAGNLAAARLWSGDADRYLLVRYEDLIAEPEPWLRRIAGLAGAASAALPVTGRVGTLAPTHTVAGNTDRHRSGRIELRLDDEWRRAMPAAQRRLVAAATSPVRQRYGYR